MRILWVGKSSRQGSAGGDEVYDRKLLLRIERSCTVCYFTPEPLGRLMKFCNIFRGIPIYRATYKSRSLINRFKKKIDEFAPDIIVISWEPLDFLAGETRVRTVLILHNITSDSITEIFKRSLLARLYAGCIRIFEQKLYSRDNVRAIVALSSRDARILRDIVPGGNVVVISPGAPPVAPAPESAIVPELFISGTYDWYPKRRDLVVVAEEISGPGLDGLQLCWDHSPPPAIASALGGMTTDPMGWNPALRFALVPDRFASGFKLKVGYYIANNCVVLSKSDILEDYADIRDHDIFIRRIDKLSDVPAVYREFSTMDLLDVLQRFQMFKLACSHRFDWDKGAESLVKLLYDNVKSG